MLEQVVPWLKEAALQQLLGEPLQLLLLPLLPQRASLQPLMQAQTEYTSEDTHCYQTQHH